MVYVSVCCVCWVYGHGWAAQKWLNLSCCCLGQTSVGPRNIMLDGGSLVSILSVLLSRQCWLGNRKSVWHQTASTTCPGTVLFRNKWSKKLTDGETSWLRFTLITGVKEESVIVVFGRVLYRLEHLGHRGSLQDVHQSWRCCHYPHQPERMCKNTLSESDIIVIIIIIIYFVQ